MEWVIYISAALSSLILGLSLGYWKSRRILGKEIASLQNEKSRLQTEKRELEVRLESEEKIHQERLQAFEEARQNLESTFKSLSAKALEESNRSFLTLAQSQFEKLHQLAQKDLESRQDRIAEIVQPVRESLMRVDLKIQEIEQSRARSEAGLMQQMRSLSEAHRELRSETSNLVAALRSPQARGRWGEMQLRRVVEMAGMIEHCDFVCQITERSEDGRLRPDMIVNLPGGKQVVVDAKTPLNAYIDGLQSSDPETKAQKMREHAKHVRKHIDELSKKSYWSQFRSSPEFVVLFLPGESFFGAALEYDPQLIEAGVSQNVIIATPTTLIALLRSVAYGWQQERLNQNVRAVADLGQELYKRLSDLGMHFSRLGQSLQKSVESYNRALGSLESRVLVSARKMNEMQIIGQMGQMPSIKGIEQSVRALSAPELQIDSPLND